MLTVTASHSFDPMVGEPVAYVQGLPKGHRADSCGYYLPDHQRDRRGPGGGGAPLSLPLGDRHTVPMSSKHLISGIIFRGRFGFVMKTDDGGIWEIDGSLIMRWSIRLASGQHVTIAGERIGFNALYVRRMARLQRPA
jgi:hypothetical protein